MGVALTLLVCLLLSCGIPYSIGSKYPDLIGRSARLKRDMVICSTEGHNIGVSGYFLLEPRQVEGLEIKTVARIVAGETVDVRDIVCVIDKGGQVCNFVCVYASHGVKYEFYFGGFEESSLVGREDEVENGFWEYVQSDNGESK